MYMLFPKQTVLISDVFFVHALYQNTIQLRINKGNSNSSSSSSSNGNSYVNDSINDDKYISNDKDKINNNNNSNSNK